MSLCLFVSLQIHLHFRPEFLNRLNDIVFFQSLNITQLSAIVHLQLKTLEERLKEQDITISLTDRAIQSTLKKSYNPSMSHSQLFIRENVQIVFVDFVRKILLFSVKDIGTCNCIVAFCFS